jgi:quinol monooxygenase YgiN
MSLRLVITLRAQPSKGADLLRVFEARCVEVRQEPGCEQYEIFQSGNDPDRLVLLERWSDQAALDVHLEVNRTRPPFPPELRAEGPTEREDYEYNRTR